MKYVLALILIIIAIAIVIKFKWFFITLAVLGLAAFIVVKYIKKRKANGAAEQLHDSNIKPAIKIDTTTAPEPTALQEPIDEHPTEEIPHPETKITAYPVKGVFAHEDEIFHNLMEYNPEYDYDKSDLIEFCVPDFPVYKWVPKDLPASLVPEPDNKYDPNAVRVVVGEYTIGYIPKGDCIEILNVLNSGKLENVAYEITGGAFKLLEEDYDPIKDKSKYSVKTGKAELSAMVYVKVRLT